MLRHRLHAGDDVADQPLALFRLHEPEQIAGLRVVVIIQPMVVTVYGAAGREGWRFSEFWFSPTGHPAAVVSCFFSITSPYLEFESKEFKPWEEDIQADV